MKELTIEQKSQRYDEAIERAKRVLLDCTPEERKVVEYISPELKESEDGRIRKEIIESMRYQMDRFSDAPNVIKKYKKWIAWLEKQGEQKPAWSEEDEAMIAYLLQLIQNSHKEPCTKGLIAFGAEAWLKSLRPQPKQEVDEQIETIAMHLDNCGNTAMAEILRSCNLRPQKRWKPSEEQIKAVRLARSFVVDDFDENPTLSEILVELEKQLKKLREE